MSFRELCDTGETRLSAIPDVGRIYPPAPEPDIYENPAHREAWLRAWEESDLIFQRLRRES